MRYEILPATRATIAATEQWLDAEEVAYQASVARRERDDWLGEKPPRGFRCNWDTTKRNWMEVGAGLDVLLADGEVAGFLAGTDILEIRPDLRGRGYGRILAEFMIERAVTEGRSVLDIEIAPETAEPFWKQMGFTVVPDRTGNGGGIYAYRLLQRCFDLADGQRVAFRINFYTEHGRYSANPKAFSVFSGLGERLPDGSVQLPQRVICFEPDRDQRGDYFVSIEVDGEPIHFDKNKYESSKAHGVRQDVGYVFYIDRVTDRLAPGS